MHRLRYEGDAATCDECGPVAPITRTKRGKTYRCCPVGRAAERQSPNRHRPYVRGTKPRGSDRVRGPGRHRYTFDEVRELVTGKECEVCGSTEKLRVDHDHATGAYRGILCNNHNLMLGHTRDDPVELRALADYLDRHAGNS